MFCSRSLSLFFSQHAVLFSDKTRTGRMGALGGLGKVEINDADSSLVAPDGEIDGGDS